ncbi:benzoylformate decarboxylase [Pandoraea apista]|uniref:Benzoylformate decarboxylase n=1 Tax=Pandoraea apista TaxID=93218 RepID=A0ABX9ZUL4_9BURK|nr:benzoylformate decarboxylase [Pandoraea apista]PTE02393.1 benzoylformate decarboxylase [Pandoraea apista]RRJ33322.1 benzoylformate decarboxylase [Pandoraea apista]RRJ82107.1 benzoylformate decarboxylase [Pandoraea apista]RSD15678.1 benzoylformate decarboxylase [Pandoraea apista]RSD24744.1 benzoylformate decarboxylase [Pandoraea apista]
MKDSRELRAGQSAGIPQALTVRDVVIDLMRRHGMTKVFANPGSTELPLFRDFPADFEYVLGLQEAVVVGMADGYAQATGNAAFINLHSAAGVGNAMGNIFTAYKNQTPLIVTAGQQARAILPFDPFLASVRATELPQPYVKFSLEPARAEDVPLALARAYHIAMQEPKGPVFVSIPVDDWDRPAETLPPRQVSTRVQPEPAALAQLGAALDACARPAFVVGSSIDRAGAFDAVIALAERHNARVFTAPMCARCAFPEDHRLFAGFLPPMREKIVGLLGGHDLILVIGAPAFTYHVEGAGPHVPEGASLFQLIEDPGVAAWTPVGASVVGNVRLGVEALLAREIPHERELPPARTAPPFAMANVPGERMTTAFALQTLAQVRDAQDIVVEEAPSARSVMQQYLPFTLPGTFYTMNSGGLGYSMPAAVGVAMAHPARRVIGLIGDGSAMYSIQGLWSAAQARLPITFVILNNRRYAALQDFAPSFGFGPKDPVQGTDLPDLDFVRLAEGMGVRAQRVEQGSELRDVLSQAISSGETRLVEIVVA